MSLLPGHQLGNYEIVAPIGSGGMGEIYRARDSRLGRDVAIKVLPGELASHPERLKRFEQEARSASSLNHPNIVTIYDIGQEGAVHFIAMELVEGRSLRELIERGPLKAGQLLRLASQVASGLAKAHAAGIVHRDLKPENIMVNGDGLVKILDFGLAKLAAEEVETASSAPTAAMITAPGVILGTVSYMSPEQASGGAVDFRSDQFSLGTIFYEMATGRRPFVGDTTTRVLAAILDGDVAPLSSLDSRVPAHFSQIVERCLAKEPRERFESTLDLANEIKRVESTHSGEVPVAERRTLPRAAVAVAFLTVVVLAFALWSMDGIRERLRGEASSHVSIDSIAVLPLDNLSGNVEEEYFVDGMTDALIAELAKVGSLKVISRTSVMRYKDSEQPLPEIARALGVRAIVAGSALRVGDEVRITAQLIEAETDQHLWAESYQRDIRDVLALQSEVARTITEEIAAELTPDEHRRLEGSRAVDPRAYEAYMKAWFFWSKATSEAVTQSVALFQQAIELEPTYAPAYQGLSAAYHMQASGLGGGPDNELFPKAKEAVLRALELDPTLPTAHSSLAFITYLYDWDWDAAERSFRRALELGPAAAGVHHTFAIFLTDMGRFDESLSELKRTLELDPLNFLARENLGRLYIVARQFEDAMEVYRELNEMDSAWGSDGIGQVLFLQGDHESAVEWLETSVARADRGAAEIARLGYIYASTGARELAEEALLNLNDRGRAEYLSPIYLAKIHLALGNHDEGFALLEQAYAERDDGLVELKVSFEYDDVRDDPRFRDLVRRVGLP